MAEDQLLASLLNAWVLIVTQRPETQGLLRPSKLAVLEKLPRSIVFVGPVEGAIAKRLQARGRSAVFAPSEAKAVAGWIEDQFNSKLPVDLPKTNQPVALEHCAVLEQWLEECVAKRQRNIPRF